LTRVKNAPFAAIRLLVSAALLTPAARSELGKWIGVAAIAGFVVAIPIASTIAKSFAGKTA
jgi:hypothetical protein